jgi:CelD/BcsL family acetyltransferase involved in cellulose biosynthesis
MSRDQIEIHTSVGPLATDWDELALRTGGSPFARPGWFSSWLGAFGADGFEVLALRRDGRLAAVLPILAGRRAVRSVTNWHTPRFELVAEDDTARRTVFAALCERRPRRIDLSFLDAADADELRAAWGPAPTNSRTLWDSPYVVVDQAWDTYWQGLSKNLRSSVRRRRKGLEAKGAVEVEVCDGGEGLHVLLEECFRLEAGGWKGERGTAINSNPETLRFYTALAEWAAGSGLLNLSLLRLDGRIIAFNYSLESGRRHYMMKLGHDVQLSALSPGTVLTAAMVERAFEVGLESYEFLGNPDRYKLQWATGSRRRVRLQLFARSPAGYADRFVQTKGRTTAIAARDHLRRVRRG